MPARSVSCCQWRSCLLHLGAVGGLAGLQLLGPQGQVGAEPVEGLLPQARSLLVVELGRVLALAGGGQRGEAGGVVAVPGLQVVGQLGVGGEGGGVQAGRRRVELLALADTGQTQAFLGVLGWNSPLRNAGSFASIAAIASAWRTHSAEG